MATHTPIRAARPLSPTAKGSALKGILRTVNTTLARRKREEDEDEAEAKAEVQSQSPTKRRKTVAFDMGSNTVQSIGFQTAGEVRKKMEDVKLIVQQALKDHNAGDQEGYDTLKGVFHSDRSRRSTPTNSQTEDDVDPSDLIYYVKALKSCAPHINRSCASLVQEVLSIPWLGRADSFVTSYIDFLANLVTGQSIYLSNVLTMLVEKFRFCKPSQWQAGDLPAVDCNVMRQRLHRAINQVLQLFPAARRVVLSLINKEFPFSDESKPVHMAFVQNLLRLRQYAPDMGPEIMELITDRLVKIDVQIQVDLDEVDDEVAAGVVSQLKSPQFDEEDDASDAESVASDESDDRHELSGKIIKAAQHIQKLDSIMDKLFQVYDPIFRYPDSDTARDVFENMLAEFVNIILPTYSSRHTQFLIFHFSQLSEHLTDRFAGVLLDIAFGNQNSMVTRQNAAAYLSSFAARGKKVPAESVRTICTVLIKHIDTYRHIHGKNARPDLRRFTPYYALFQGLLYIFCFRWRDLIVQTPGAVDPDDPASYLGHGDEIEWLDELKPILHANIWSEFKPLRVCHPTIVQEFAKLAGHLGFMYTHDKIELDRRIYLSSFVSSSVEALRETAVNNPYDESWLQLTPYFPFDPYQLPESHHWVDDDYVPYTPFPGLDDDEGSEPDEMLDVDETFGNTTFGENTLMEATYLDDDTETDEGSGRR